MNLSPALSTWLVAQGFPADNLKATIANRTTPLMHASRLGEYDFAAELIRCGTELNATNNDGNNALWLACFSGNLKLISLLIENGVNPDNQNENGTTCLMYASSAGKSEVVALLLKAGANTKLQLVDGYTALDVAGNVECLMLLRRA
ncbi:MAG: ankyrin repeat domain-containing protein [Gallionellaceae bacterium]|jgi:thiosulfate/3-mercaptopyruvate sulfurtransferase